MAKASGINQPAKRVLAFSLNGTLLAAFKSMTVAAQFVNRRTSTLSDAVKFNKHSAGYLWICEDSEIEIEASDLGSLQLKEYDNMCGVIRPYLTAKEIKKIRSRKNENGKFKS